MLDKSLPFIGVIMVKTDIKNYPRFELPPGYRFSGFQAGFEERWARLMFSVDQTDTLDEARTLFAKEFLTESALLPKRCVFVLDEHGEAVAAASLWHGGKFGKDLPRIHFVAAAPEHQEKGLVKALMTRLLDIHNGLGLGDFLYLTTQTWSYKAINIYERFGFAPYTGEKPALWQSDDFGGENERAWEMIHEKIGQYKTLAHY